MQRTLLLIALIGPLAHAAVWRAAPGRDVEIRQEDGGISRIVSRETREFELTSIQEYKAQPGDTFEIALRIRVDIHTRALADIACYDASGREIPVRSPLATGPSTQTTHWQSFRRVFPVRPGTATVRARVRADGRGEFQLAALEFRAARIDPYQTGALVSQIYPGVRRGLVLESNHGIVNRELLSKNDEDGDGKWAVITIDLDKVSHPEQPAEDWRTRFQYRPDVLYWSDGAVLKSDSVRQDRPPDISRALHFRMRVHPGPYRAILNDPCRAIAVSLDGRTWKRYEGGSEAELGALPAADGYIEFWVDACYRDPVSAGPAYFDYVRLFPVDRAPSADRLFAAARRHPEPPARGSVEERKVPVAVAASLVASWPVRCGLPVPQGELASAENANVLDDQGNAVPSQNRALATWPDGSVKWLFLDFPAAGARYTVAYGNRVRPAPSPHRVNIREAGDGIEIDTGAIRFLVPRRRFGMVEDVRLASGQVLQREPLSLEIAETAGRVWRALDLPVEKLTVEQAGPLHAVVLAETARAAPGKPSSGFQHRARIHAYAGSPLVEVDYFTANTDSRPEVAVRSISLRLRPAARAASSGAAIQSTAEGRAQGWHALDGEAQLAAGVSEFREQYPKALRWSPERLQIDLWAPEGGEYEWIQGVGKTHHLAFLYGNTKAAEQLARGPVLALAEPQWYTASGAFGPIDTAARSPLPEVEKTLAAHIQGNVVGKVGLGFENYGDHSSSGYVKGSYLWDNNEYDLPAGALIHFVRTGDTAALRIGLASALHYVDVDTIHYSYAHPEWVDAPHTHSHGNVGHHTADKPGMHHAGYVQGLILYSYFTGDPAGLLGARGIAGWVLRNMKPESSVGQMERATGHPLMTLNDVYEATWDEQYLRGSARLVDWTMKWEDPVRGGFPAPITEQPAYYSGGPFCGGLLSAALIKFNSWARLPEIDAMLERSARWLLTDMWRPPANIMSKGGPVTRDSSADRISSHLRLLSVVTTTSDPLFLAVPRESVVAGFGRGAEPFGTRSTGLVFNYLPWYLRRISELRDPEPDPALAVRGPTPAVDVAPGAAARVCFAAKNQGAEPVGDLRMSFQPRLDFSVAVAPSARVTMAPGESAEFCYEVRAPERINLTSEYNRISYAHWSAAFTREGRPHIAHTWVKFVLPAE